MVPAPPLPAGRKAREDGQRATEAGVEAFPAAVADRPAAREQPAYLTYDDVQAYRREHDGRDPYLAQPGDTLAIVAAEHGLTTAQVRRLNGIGVNVEIKPG